MSARLPGVWHCPAVAPIPFLNQTAGGNHKKANSGIGFPDLLSGLFVLDFSFGEII